MNEFDILIKGDIVNEKEIIKNGFVCINGEKIAFVGSGNLPKAKQIYDFSGHFIMPGGIDSQVHSYSQLNQEGFKHSTKSAASGGITTIIDMPYDANNLICNLENFNKKVKLIDEAIVDVGLYATIDPNDGVKHIKELIKAGAIGFKFSTFGTDPKRFPRIANYLLFECFKEIAPFNLVCSVHNENEEAVNYYLNKVKSSGVTDYNAHLLSRPNITETLAMAEIYELGLEAKCKAHVVHCSLSRGYEMCKFYQLQGANSSIEACIHYLTLSHDKEVPKLKGFSKCNPPIRQSKETKALWEHLKNDEITVVSTDHVSWSKERKNNPIMLENASGMPGLEVIYPLLLTGCLKREISFTKAAKVMAYNPAKLFCISEKGKIEVGRDADISIFKYEPYIYDSQKSGNNIANWSPYDGMQIDFKSCMTFLRGKVISKNQEILANNGKFIKPTKT